MYTYNLWHVVDSVYAWESSIMYPIKAVLLAVCLKY
jgi:hypothetical protein